MNIYKTDRKILRIVKKAQGSLGKYVYIDVFNPCIYHLEGSDIENRNRAFAENPFSKLKFDTDTIHLSIQNLMDADLLNSFSSGIYQVTYHGWNYRAVRRSEIVNKLVTHILFPSLVAFITTLITLLISSIF